MPNTFPASALQGQRGASQGGLTVIEGEIPKEVAGSWYIVAAIGDVAEGMAGGERQYRVPFLNGDGHVTRVSFVAGKASYRKRPVATPCYLADVAAAERKGPDPEKWRFRNFGLARISPTLGSRNFANTALQAVKFPGESARLLVTYDAGRPVELDPNTLAYRGSVGDNAVWHGQMLGFLPFRLLGSTAHPAWDGHTQTLYVCENGRAMVGFVASLGRLIRRMPPRQESWTNDGVPVRDERALENDVIRSDEEFAKDFVAPGSPAKQLAAVKAWLDLHEKQSAEDGRKESYQARSERFGPDLLGSLLTHAFARARRALSWREAYFATVPPDDPRLTPPYLRILEWKGDNAGLRSWEVRHPDNSAIGHRPIAIRSSSHQMVATRNFVVIFDTSFKFEMDLAMPHPDEPGWVTQSLRRRLSAAQPLTARAYVVRKSDLVPGNSHVVAHPFKIQGEIVHLSADYEDDGSRIIIHAVDNRATDPAEFLLKGDLKGFDNRKRVPDELLTMMPCGLDVNAVSTYRLEVHGDPSNTPRDSNTEMWRRAELLGASEDRAVTWTIALGTAEGLFGCRPQPERLAASWWYCHGLDGDLVNEIVYALYDFDDQPGRRPRVFPMDEVHAAADKGIRPSLIRVEHARNRGGGAVRHIDAPVGCIFATPQLVPGGWLMVVVLGKSALPGATERELWILEADTLERVCRIDASQIEVPYTLHSTWIEQADLPQMDASAERDNVHSLDDYAHVTDEETRAFLAEVFKRASAEGGRH